MNIKNAANRIIFTLVASCLSASALSAPIFYTDRGTFDAANPGLVTEDFEGLTVAPGGLTVCGSAGVSSASAGACGPAGTVIPGFTFNSFGGGGGEEELALGAGFNGNPSTILSSNTFADSVDLLFSGPVSAVGFDLFTNFAPDPAVMLSIFGPGNVLLGTTTAPGTNGGSFWGVSDSMSLITRINIFSNTNQAEGIDNLSFGGAGQPASGPVPVPEPGTLALLGLGLASMGLTRRRKSVSKL